MPQDAVLRRSEDPAQGAIDCCDDLINIIAGGDQRGRETQRVVLAGQGAVGSADDHPLGHAIAHHGLNALFLNRGAAVAVRHQFSAQEQPLAAHVADHLVLVGQRAHQRVQCAAIDAAVDAGVQHIVYISYVDADNNPSPIAVDHRLTEAILRENGVAWTFIRDQWYMDRLVQQATSVLEDGRVVAGPQAGTAFVTRADCAAAAAAALSTPGHENRIYEITGPELISSREFAAIQEITRTEDCHEGIRAFLGKRNPNYRGPHYEAWPYEDTNGS